MDSIARHILSLSRRGLLRGATAAAALAAITPAARGQTPHRFTSDPFTLGVASGDPWPDGFVIWTRLAPEPLTGGGLPRAAIAVTWEVAEDEGFGRIVAQGLALARPELGHSVHVEVGGLPPGRPFFYRFRADGAESRVGRSRTAPALDALPARLRIVSAGCQHYEVGFFTAWRHIAEEPELDLVAHYGDYIYEYAARPEGTGRPPVVRSHRGLEIHTLEDYRARHALYRLDPDLQAAHAAHPFVMSFDDHEVDNNWAGAISEEDGKGRFPVAVPPEIFALRKQAAFQAWYEAMPVRRAQLPAGPAITAWRGLRWGRLADLAVLDTRSHRDDQPCGDVTGPPCAAVANPAAQVLGPAQEEWLMRRLAGSDATWKVLAQQVPMMPRDLGAESSAISMDKWDAYPAARARLLNHIAEARVTGVTVLTGDVHNAWTGRIHRDPADPNSPVVAHEFIATSITSGGDGSDTLPGTARMLARNPHVAMFNNRRGYTVLEARPEAMEARFRALPHVSRAGAPVADAARFTLAEGRLHRG